MLSEKLKELTKANHQLLEKKIVTRLKAINDVRDYAVVLGIFYSFFGGLEILIKKHIDQILLPDYDYRRKTNLLADDLIHLTGVLRSKATAKDLPPIKNHAQAMGAMYVIEGSTLGGQIIVKMIFKQLNVQDLDGTTYFDGYKDQTTSMWQTFQQQLNDPYYADKQDSIIESANNTFFKLSQWFDTSS